MTGRTTLPFAARAGRSGTLAARTKPRSTWVAPEFLSGLLAALGLSAAVCAEEIEYAFGFLDDGNTLSQSTIIGIPVAGTFMGDYDERTNPDGTLTQPGIAGGSGNNPIGYEATLTGASNAITTPTGGVLLLIDEAEGTVAVGGLTLEIAPTPPIPLNGEISVVYSTFHTVNPTALFFGGIPLMLPFGEVAQVTFLQIQQTEGVVGTLTPLGGSAYTVSADLPIGVVVDGVVLGEPIGTEEPLPGTLPFEATVTLSGVPTLDVSSTGAFAANVPIDPVPFEDVPFDVPTVLPPGGTASLLLDGVIDNFTVDLQTTIEVSGNGAPDCGAGDLDCSGVVDGNDLGLLLSVWGTFGPFADFNGDGIVDAADLGILLAAWG